MLPPTLSGRSLWFLHPQGAFSSHQRFLTPCGRADSALGRFLLKCLLSRPPKFHSMNPPEPRCLCLPSELSSIPPFSPSLSHLLELFLLRTISHLDSYPNIKTALSPKEPLICPTKETYPEQLKGTWVFCSLLVHPPPRAS